MASIDDLIDALDNVGNTELPNTAETWARIRSRDDFAELGLSKEDLQKYLEEWMNNNPYENI